MRHAPVPVKLFIENREQLKKLLPPNSVAIVNANDILPTNGDGTLLMQPNSDLFYLTGIEQEESILLLAPNAFNEKQREILFLREPNEHLKVWEGHKHSKEQAQKISGIQQVKWLSEFPALFQQLMLESEHVYLNRNEHNRAALEVETRDDRFVRNCQTRYPLHDYQRLAPLLQQLRVVKSEIELDLIRRACAITRAGFMRVLRVVKPGINEAEIEGEFAREFLRRHGGFAFNPIIASGANSCILHYNQNDQVCRKGQVLLLDVAANYANYNADLTRTIPVSGRFTRRQRQVYDAVLRVLRAMTKAAVPGKFHRDWQKESEAMMTEELLRLGFIKPRDVKKQDPDKPACKKYFNHGIGHSLGLVVHDVGSLTQPFAVGRVFTVEPGIYIPEEGFGIRLENDVLITDNGTIDLMADIPIEAEEIEHLMARRQ